MKIIAVANQKGGVGKSTSTINIASMLAKYGYNILIIDMDPQGHCTKGLGIRLEKDEPTVADVLCCDLDKHYEGLLSSVVKETYIDNLSIIPSNLKLALVEMELGSMGAKEFKLRSAVQNIGSSCYDYIFIDCPPTFTTLPINAFTIAEEIIMPVQMNYFCMEGIDGFVQAVNFVNKRINNVVNHRIDIRHVLITFYDPRTKLSKSVFENMNEIFADRMLETQIPVNIKLSEAQANGKAIIDYDPSCSGCKAYINVTDELLRRWAPRTVCSKGGI